MTATTVDQSTTTRTSRRSSPLVAIAGVGALAAFVPAALVWWDLLWGVTTPAGVADALEAAPVEPASLLLTVYALLGIVVVGRLTARLARGGETTAVRLLPLLGAAHLLLLAAAFAAPAAAVLVGTQVLDTGVTTTAAETSLLVMNIGQPLSALVGAAFLFAVTAAARASGAPRSLSVVSAVFAVGLMLPPVGWAVTYLMALWFAGVGIWLWLRG